MIATMRFAIFLAHLVIVFAACSPGWVLAADTAGGVANWFETVAEAERMAEAEIAKQKPPLPPPPAPGPAPDGNQLPPQPAIGPGPAANLNELQLLIDKRNKLVNNGLFNAIKRVNAGGKANPQEMRSLTDWFTTYFRMRAFVPANRRDPNVGAVIGILDNAVKRRGDFVEGRILLVPCLLYAGRHDDAKQHLQGASDFLTNRGLNPTPFGLDCCAGWLRLGQPDQVRAFIVDLKNPKIVPNHKLNAVQALLVAIHSWQTFRFNDAKDYFEKSLRRADAFNKAEDPAPGVQSLLADAAFFYLAAGNAATRDAGRGVMLMGRIPEANQSWEVLRARAALSAAQAKDAQGPEADRFWADAVRLLEDCRKESLPTLDDEIDEQLARYRLRELWYRERPKDQARPKDVAAGDEAAREAADGAVP